MNDKTEGTHKLSVGDQILLLDNMPGTAWGEAGDVYDVKFVSEDGYGIGIFPAEGLPFRCGSVDYTHIGDGRWFRVVSGQEAIDAINAKRRKYGYWLDGGVYTPYVPGKE